MLVQRLNIPLLLMRPNIVIVGGLVIAFLFTFFSTFSSLAGIWWTRNDLSHGFLVPLISLYMVWTMRERLKSLPAAPHRLSGILVMITAGLMLIAGKASSIIAVQGLSMIVMLAGITLLLWGATHLRALIFPLAYLILMLPILGIGTEKIHWPFQLLAAQMSSELLQLLNIPVFRNVQYLELPNVSLEVAYDCSGVNYLVSIIAIGIPLAYFTQKTFTRMVMLMVLAIAIGIAANWFRVVLIALLAYYGGEASHGPWHIFKGVFISVIGFIFLFIGAVVLAKIPIWRTRKVQKKEQEIQALPSPSPGGMLGSRQEWVIALVMLVVLGSYSFARHPQPVPLIKPLSELPLTIDGWRGEPLDSPAEFFKLEGTDSEVTRVYRNAVDDTIILYIGYFELQRQGAEIIQHHFLRLHDHLEKVDIPANPRGPLRINHTVVNDKTQHSSVLFWSDLNGRIINNRHAIIATTIMDGILYGRSNGSVVIIYSWVDRPGDLQRVLDNETRFVQSLMTVLYDHLPSSSHI